MSSKPPATRPANPDKIQFCRACARFATGITVATVMGSDGAPHGMTANSFTSVSLAPPLVLVCVGHNSNVLPYLRTAERFGVNILSEEQQHLSELFARKGFDRFDGVDWYRGETGVPLLEGVLATIECSRYQMIPAGDHDILMGEVLHVRWREGRPLIYFGSRYNRLEA